MKLNTLIICTLGHVLRQRRTDKHITVAKFIPLAENQIAQETQQPSPAVPAPRVLSTHQIPYTCLRMPYYHVFSKALYFFHTKTLEILIGTIIERR